MAGTLHLLVAFSSIHVLTVVNARDIRRIIAERMQAASTAAPVVPRARLPAMAPASAAFPRAPFMAPPPMLARPINQGVAVRSVNVLPMAQRLQPFPSPYSNPMFGSGQPGMMMMQPQITNPVYPFAASSYSNPMDYDEDYDQEDVQPVTAGNFKLGFGFGGMKGGEYHGHNKHADFGSLMGGIMGGVAKMVEAGTIKDIMAMMLKANMLEALA